MNKYKVELSFFLLSLFFLPASSSSPHLAPELEQARPQTSGEEELQLQLALAMSREESEKVRILHFSATTASAFKEEDALAVIHLTTLY